jgi:hypothetical protein
VIIRSVYINIRGRQRVALTEVRLHSAVLPHFRIQIAGNGNFLGFHSSFFETLVITSGLRYHVVIIFTLKAVILLSFKLSNLIFRTTSGYHSKLWNILLQFKPINVPNLIKITIILKYAISYVFWASLIHHQWMQNCKKWVLNIFYTQQSCQKPLNVINM